MDSPIDFDIAGTVGSSEIGADSCDDFPLFERCCDVVDHEYCYAVGD